MSKSDIELARECKANFAHFETDAPPTAVLFNMSQLEAFANAIREEREAELDALKETLFAAQQALFCASIDVNELKAHVGYLESALKQTLFTDANDPENVDWSVNAQKLLRRSPKQSLEIHDAAIRADQTRLDELVWP